MSFRILATADIHIGRRPSKLPDVTQAQRFSCARMWEETIVDRAIREKVDLVALTGDAVDHDNRFFEATGPLERGLVRLAEAGIPTYAVAGNHDFDVLPRLVDAIGPEHFHFLGAGGAWDEAIFQSRDGHKLRIHGYSFPSNYVPTSPLARYDLAPDADVPTLGLLHADLDAGDSSYGPVSRAELAARDVTLWLLGHVHAAQFYPAAAGPAILYPGSPQAMDPGETGVHGPWLVEIAGPRQVTARPLGMSRVRYEQLAVDLGGAATQEEFQARVTAECRRRLAEVASGDGPPERLVLRLELVGRTAVCGQVEGWVGPLAEEFDPSAGGVTATIDKVTNNTRPEIDLEELAAKHDPPGVLAGVLLRLESGQGEEELKVLLREAHQKMLQVHRSATYARIDDGPPDLDAARRCLLHQGMLLLETLRSQEKRGQNYFSGQADTRRASNESEK